MFITIYINGVKYDTVGDPEFEFEGNQEFGYVTMIRADEAVCIAKYKTEDEELPDDLSNPIDNLVVAEPWE